MVLAAFAGRVDSGQWMAQEKPEEVNGILVRWLATEVEEAWARAGPAAARL